MKSKRQAKIMEIISTSNVETQEQLLSELQAAGFNSTQATISRDIKELRLIKELSASGGYRYTNSERRTAAGNDMRLRNIFKEGVTAVDLAQNLIVIKTMPGLASAACSALDSMEIPGMVGTLAGDDTAILIMRDNQNAQHFISEVHNLLR